MIRPIRRLGVSGMSSLEIAIALSIVAIAVGASFPSFLGAMGNERLEGWARSMTADIAAARQAAITERTSVNVSLTSTTYLIQTISAVTIRQATLPSDITLANTCTADICTFNRMGIPTSTGTITLTNTNSSRTYVISIEPGTGRVSYRAP